MNNIDLQFLISSELTEEHKTSPENPQLTDIDHVISNSSAIRQAITQPELSDQRPLFSPKRQLSIEPKGLGFQRIEAPLSGKPDLEPIFSEHEPSFSFKVWGDASPLRSRPNLIPNEQPPFSEHEPSFSQERPDHFPLPEDQARHSDQRFDDLNLPNEPHNSLTTDPKTCPIYLSPVTDERTLQRSQVEAPPRSPQSNLRTTQGGFQFKPLHHKMEELQDLVTKTLSSEKGSREFMELRQQILQLLPSVPRDRSNYNAIEENLIFTQLSKVI